MTRVRLSAIACLFAACCLTATSVAAEEAMDSTGVWQGAYVCGQGETQLRLTIMPQNADTSARNASFYFTPKPGARDRSAGCFTMRQAPDGPEGHAIFRQVKWIKAPPFYIMVDLDGTFDPASLTYWGVVLGPGCGTFKLTRVLSEANAVEACEPFSQ
jgi:hypothetical protein